MRKSSGSDLKASKKFMAHLKANRQQSAGQDKKMKINEQTPYQSQNYYSEQISSKPTVDIAKLLLKQKKS